VRAHLAQVVPCAERRAIPGQHDGAQLRVLVQLRERARERIEQLRVERVALRGAVEGQVLDTAGARAQQGRNVDSVRASLGMCRV
jgi:hypothetical protein